MKVLLVTSILTHTLLIPKTKRFSNEEDLVLEFGKGKNAVEMPEDIFEAFSKSKPGAKYKVVDGSKSEDETEESPKEDAPVNEDVEKCIKWVEEQGETEEGITKEALETLELKDLFIVASICSVNNIHPKTGKVKLVERILGVLNSKEDE